MHISTDDIREVEVINPILIGSSVVLKNYVLDVLVTFNSGELANFEMQVKDEKNWPERAISYLCREWGRFHHGDDYSDARPVYHIGFLGFTLFRDRPKFYSRNFICDIDDGHIFSNKFNLGVIE